MQMNSTPKTYKSKIGLEIFVPLFLVLLFVWITVSFNGPFWLGTAIILPVILFIWYLLATTYYTITEGHLIARAGFLHHSIIDIQRIKRITETNNPLSSPANSLDRLAIIYNENRSVLISPKDKHGFIAHLLALNPEIEVVYRKKKA
jgi:uncharacterized membrane protein YdbT with pleckstrin-like domain